MVRGRQFKALGSCIQLWTEWLRDAVWLRFEQQAWEKERQRKAERRGANRNASDQIHRDIRSDLKDVNISLCDLRSMLTEEFGSVQGAPPRGSRREEHPYQLSETQIVHGEHPPPFVPAGGKGRVERGGRKRKNKPGNLSPPPVGPRQSGAKLHALTGSPPKRGQQARNLASLN
jgi:hypothetical protein